MARLRAPAGGPGRLAYRIAVGIVGALVFVLGLVLVPLPGPGWLIAFLGLSILASEFAWAAAVRTGLRSRLRIFMADLRYRRASRPSRRRIADRASARRDVTFRATDRDPLL